MLNKYIPVDVRAQLILQDGGGRSSNCDTVGDSFDTYVGGDMVMDLSYTVVLDIEPGELLMLLTGMLTGAQIEHVIPSCLKETYVGYRMIRGYCRDKDLDMVRTELRAWHRPESVRHTWVLKLIARCKENNE
jgi:hypothetical protein